MTGETAVIKGGNRELVLKLLKPQTTDWDVARYLLEIF